MTAFATPGQGDEGGTESAGLTLVEAVAILWLRRWRLLMVTVAAGLLALGASYLIAPTYTARTSLIPPQQGQSAAAVALSQLGALASLAGGSAGLKSTSDLYVALMQSTNVADRLIDEFELMKSYETPYRFEARRLLAANTRIGVGKKDGMITVEVDDTSPERAARMANRYVDELQRLSGELALTEAQRRRAFFEGQLQQVSTRLARAQAALQASGINQGTLKAEPKAAAEGYAQLRAEVTSAEVRLQTLRQRLTDTAPEVQQQLAQLVALKSQLGKLELTASSGTGGPDYISSYREFKYQEALFELFARQLEMARLDESREGTLVQIVDVAQTPEWKSKPKRAFIAAVGALGALGALAALILIRASLQLSGDGQRLLDAIRRMKPQPR